MIEVKIPGPIRPELSPNASRKMHWGTKTKARNELREDTTWCIYELKLQRRRFTPPIHYTVEVGLAKGEKTKDDDNIAGNGTLKVIRDTLAHAMTAGEDKHWHCDGITQVRDPEKKGYVLFRIKE